MAAVQFVLFRISTLGLRALVLDRVRCLRITPNVRGNVQWYVVALLVYPVLTAVVD